MKNEMTHRIKRSNNLKQMNVYEILKIHYVAFKFFNSFQSNTKAIIENLRIALLCFNLSGQSAGVPKKLGHKSK